MNAMVFPEPLDALMEIAGTAWLRVDSGGRVLACSAGAMRLLGHEPATLQTLPEWERLLEGSSGRSTGVVLRRRFSRVRGAGDRLLNVWVSATAVADNCFDVLLISCEEFNTVRGALDDAIHRYQTVLEQSQNGVYIATAERLVFVNAAFAEMLAYRESELIGMPCATLTHDDDREAVEGSCHSLLSGEATASEFTVRLWMKDRIGMRDVSVRASRVWFDGQWCLLGTVYDITDLRRGEAALRDYARRLRLLSQQVIDVQEKERRHLARELHDEIGQQLTLVKLSLEALRDGGGQGDAPLQDALASVNILVEQIRSLSLDLRPSMLDDLGLGATLRWYATRAARIGSMQLTSVIDPDFPRLRSEAETLFFRVAQEAITNVLRHAGARHLELELSASSELIELNIADDGCGFDPTLAGKAILLGGSSGLLGMQERAALGGASLQIESAPGKGALLHLVMPVSCAIPPAISA